MSKIIAVLRTKSGISKDDIKMLDALSQMPDDDDGASIRLVYADSTALRYGSGLDFPIYLEDDPVAKREELITELYHAVIIPLHKKMLQFQGEGVSVGCHELYIPLKPYLKICDFFNKTYNEQVSADNFDACAKLLDLIRYAMESKERDLDDILEGIGVTTVEYERWMKEIVA